MSSREPVASDLIVIARDASGSIMTRITCTRSRDLVGAMRTARGVLRLKADAVRVEVHHQESPTSDYHDKPLASLSRDDLPLEQIR